MTGVETSVAVPFDAATAVRETGPGRFAAELDPAWGNEIGPHGGGIAATALRAMIATLDDPGRSPRTLTTHFLRAPQPGSVDVEVVVERAGRRLTTVTASVHQDARLCVRSVAVFAVAGADPGASSLDPPPPERASAPMPRHRGWPPFAEHADYLLDTGPVFGGPGVAAQTGGWIRLSEPHVVDAPTLAYCADAWYPAIWASAPGPVPTTSVELTVYFREPTPLDLPAGTWLRSRFASRRRADAMVDEDGELWTPDGRLVAQSRQLRLVLGEPAP